MYKIISTTWWSLLGNISSLPKISTMIIHVLIIKVKQGTITEKLPLLKPAPASNRSRHSRQVRNHLSLALLGVGVPQGK